MNILLFLKSSKNIKDVESLQKNDVESLQKNNGGNNLITN